MRQYVFDLTDKYISYLLKKKKSHQSINRIKAPPKSTKLKNQKINNKKLSNLNKISSKKNKPIKQKNIKKKKFNNKIFVINNVNNINNSLINNSPELSNNPLNCNYIYSRSKIIGNNNKDEKFIELKINFENYLLTDYEDMDFDEAIERDKRKFCEIFYDNLKKKLLILNFFLNHEPFQPRPIKLIVIIIYINIYLFINGILFNEDFISQIFHLNEDEENFFSFISRSLDRAFYTIIVVISANNLFGCFFIEEKKIKVIFKREKKLRMLKNKVYQLLKMTLNRFIYFIIISLVFTIFTFYYIACFNNIYPHTKNEWINSSIFIIIIRQLFSISISFLDVFIRYLSFLLESEKIFRISSFLS